MIYNSTQTKIKHHTQIEPAISNHAHKNLFTRFHHRPRCRPSKNELQAFAHEHNVRIASFYTEQLSGAKLERAELARLIEGSHRGSVLLIEKVDRLSHLPFEQWKELKQKLVEISLYSINR
ncbi:recombinase family protein [Vibrio parahaemolyticus]|nr:recombinase family protein [Vibrio parahaemolyticus]MDN4712590.1 recombinase family protein [Vibrio parahaemolyticus]